MPVATSRQPDSLVHTSLITELPDLDLSSPLWRLKDGEASEILGMDVVFVGTFRSDRGRKPIGVSIPEADRPITDVMEMNAEALVPVRKSYVVQPTGLFSVEIPNTANYITATGQLTAPGGTFTDYFFRGVDLLLIRDPVSMRGPHRMLFNNRSGGIINLQVGLTAVNTTVTRSVLSQGRTLLAVSYDSTQDALVKSPDLYTEEGGWDPDFVGAVLQQNPDSRVGVNVDVYGRSVNITEVGTYAQNNDALVFPTGMITFASEDKAVVTANISKDRRGFLVTNGRKFWRQAGGAYELLLDLGTDVALGTRWRMARIASNRFMLVSPDYAPRILHLKKDPMTISVVSRSEILAGCIPPQKPPGIETLVDTLDFTEKEGVLSRIQTGAIFNIHPSWHMRILPSASHTQASGLTAGVNLKALVRGVNLEDNIASDFVKVISHENQTITTFPTLPITDDTFSQLVAVDDLVGLGVMGGLDDDTGADDNRGFAPPIHPRITHIEVWRTLSDSNGVFSLEFRINLVDVELGELVVLGNNSNRTLVFAKPVTEHLPIALDDVSLTRLPILTNTENTAGGLPPICRDVVQLFGVTLCFGKAASSPTNPTIHARNFFSRNLTYDTSLGHIINGDAGTNEYLYYVWQDGDQFVTWFGGADTGAVAGLSFPLGVFDITSRVDQDTIAIEANLTSADISDEPLHGYIRRAYTIDWPAIDDDENVWFSRMDTFGPESFPPRVLQLSRIGDTFRRAVIVGSQVAVIMDQGVHLLRIVGVSLLKETVADTGAGTPWSNSVVVVGNVVFWATPQGIRTLTVAVEGGDSGARGRIGFFQRKGLEQWFRDAADDGDLVDAGFDAKSQTLRFRRKKADHDYQVLQIGFRSGKISLLDDDNGVAYARSPVAEPTPVATPPLYSVDPLTGAVFEMNFDGSTHPYDGKVVQTTLDDDYVFTPTSIRHRTTQVFSTAMVGDIIRFRRGTLFTATRTILTATPTKLTFATVASLSVEDEFLIGAVRQRIRFAPIRGSLPENPKTLKKLSVRAYPGDRGAGSPLTIRSYENFSSESRASDTVSAFNDGDTGKTSRDRVSSLVGQGSALELEIESLEARNDLNYDVIRTTVQEELDEASDADSG